MNLVIDRGNTQVKFGIFDQCKLIYSDSIDFLDEWFIDQHLKQYPIDHIILSTVVKEQHQTLITNLAKLSNTIIELTHETPLPFKWIYRSQATMGKDRLAAVAGAMFLYPSHPLLVIDAGTAITYELVDDKNVYMGGNISPGMTMRFNALNHYTSKLPLLDPNPDELLMGDCTNSAIRAGIQNGITYEIEGTFDRLKEQFPSIKAIITGGDAEFFARQLKNPIFVHPNLVLIGLNRILEYNAQHI